MNIVPDPGSIRPPPGAAPAPQPPPVAPGGIAPPDASFAPPAAAPAPGGGLTPDAGSIQAPPQVSGLESFGRGALQGATLGFSDEISGAIESLFSSKTYAKARDEARANNAAAAAANPISYGAGNIAGSVASAAIPGLGIAKGAGLAAAAGKAALGGGIAALGSSEADLTRGQFGQAASDVAQGAAVGGVLGGALHAVGSKIGAGAGEAFEKDANADIYGKARAKDALKAARMQGANPEIAKEVAYSADFRPVQELARAGKTEEARDAAQEFVDKVSANRLDHYAAASDAGATGTAGSVVQRLRQEASAAGGAVGRKEEAKALNAMADHIQEARSVTDTAKLPPELAPIKASLPPSATKAEVWDAAIKASGVKSAGEVPEQIAKAIDATPFAYDPKAPIPLLALRKITTAAQNASAESLGTVAENQRARITGSVTKAVNDALESHLDAAAAASPKARAAVEAIRHDDRVIALGLSAKDGLEQKLNKEIVGRGGTLQGRIAEGVGKSAKIASLGLLATGHGPGALALHAAPYALSAVSGAARKGNDTLARLLYAETQGSQYAKNVLGALRATPQGAARLAALQGPGQPPGGPADGNAPNP